MRFDKYIPCEILRPYVKYFVISENEKESAYKVFPTAGIVVGFQYKGELSILKNRCEIALDASGITGISESYKVFKNSPGIGTVLVFFTETGFNHFSVIPANEFSNLSLSLHDLFSRNKVEETEEKLSVVNSDSERISIVEQFLFSQLKIASSDKLIDEAVRLISESKGTIKIGELNEKLFISQSPFEKRFRKIVGTSPKKFASIVRFNAVLEQIGKENRLSEICYENNFFDQSHFIRDFKQYTGETPEKFKKFH